MITESVRHAEASPRLLHGKAYSYTVQNLPILIDRDELFGGQGPASPGELYDLHLTKLVDDMLGVE